VHLLGAALYYLVGENALGQIALAEISRGSFRNLQCPT
jgi:hypothetical protein